MSNALRNMFLMDYYNGRKNSTQTLAKVVRYYKNGRLTRNDYEQILDVLEHSILPKQLITSALTI